MVWPTPAVKMIDRNESIKKPLIRPFTANNFSIFVLSTFSVIAQDSGGAGPDIYVAGSVRLINGYSA
jgi:hypothetical protein